MQSAPPGSHWYVGGEPNKTATTGASFADVFHHYYTNIKAADLTARVTGPSILNWDFTCVGCGLYTVAGCEGVAEWGYRCGKVWLQEFISSYETAFGEKPPVDAWAIDVYPIDWSNTPNNDPDQPGWYAAEGVSAKHSYIATRQLERMRLYLDENGYEGTPIWITEIAIHVGYDGWTWVSFDPPKLDPVGVYHWDRMSDYLLEVLDWLEANAASHKIERWFFFTTYRDIVDVSSDGYMGTTFFDGPAEGSSLNCLGEAYRARVLGLPRLTCDAAGNSVPAVAPASLPPISWPGLVSMGVAVAFLIALRIRKKPQAGRAWVASMTSPSTALSAGSAGPPTQASRRSVYYLYVASHASPHRSPESEEPW